MEHNKLSFQEAIDFVNQLTRKRLDEYVDAKAKLPKFGPGFIDWTFMTPRYFGDEAVKVKETGVVKLMAPIALDAHVVVEA
ncbi:hypothetical protein RSOLAG22IIIB_07765 [Rhizoctonia solani]|uniref:Uncharacterized protein n=1 Tax=Rhizoctonia solani TaxID=456999 RepID=A0A0K6FQ51_9AGAM|nr:hypothetical protein RSOLAG22IIIB_07765 [Rhizoctonia solani]